MFQEPRNETAELVALLAMRDEPMSAAVFSQLSHLLFIAVIVRAVQHRHWMTLVLTTMTLGQSLLYHACQAFNTCLGMLLIEHQAADHLTATLQFINLGLLYLAPNEKDEGKWSLGGNLYLQIMIPIQLVGTALALFAQPYSLYPVIVAVQLVAIGFIVNALLFRREPPLHLDEASFGLLAYDIHPTWLTGSLLAGLFGAALFLLDVPGSAIHSSWHVFASLHILFALEAVHQRTGPVTTVGEFVKTEGY